MIRTRVQSLVPLCACYVIFYVGISLSGRLCKSDWRKRTQSSSCLYSYCPTKREFFLLWLINANCSDDDVNRMREPANKLAPSVIVLKSKHREREILLCNLYFISLLLDVCFFCCLHHIGIWGRLHLLRRSTFPLWTRGGCGGQKYHKQQSFCNSLVFLCLMSCASSSVSKMTTTAAMATVTTTTTMDQPSAAPRSSSYMLVRFLLFLAKLI